MTAAYRRLTPRRYRAVVIVLASLVGPAFALPGPEPATATPRCDEQKLICVSTPAENSPISNPLELSVEVKEPDIEVGWELKDSTGQVLVSASTFDYMEAFSKATGPSKTLHLKVYGLLRAKASDGTFTITPFRTNVENPPAELPKLTIPVRLETIPTILIILSPKDWDAYKREAENSLDDNKPFRPTTVLVTQPVPVMKLQRDDVAGAMAEAILQAHPGQEHWHVTNAWVKGDTAHVAINSPGWAGVSYYSREVFFLIEKSLLRLNGIRHVVFDPGTKRR